MTNVNFTVRGINIPLKKYRFGGYWPTLRDCYEYACDQYAHKFCDMYGYDYNNCWWIADEVGGVFAVNDLEYSIGMDDLIYAVDQQVSMRDFDEWWEYTIEFDAPLNTMSLRSYMNIKRIEEKQNDKHS